MGALIVIGTGQSLKIMGRTGLQLRESTSMLLIVAHFRLAQDQQSGQARLVVADAPVALLAAFHFTIAGGEGTSTNPAVTM